MAKCRNCGNTTNFNVWCNIKKILEVELDEKNNLRAVVGEPEDETLQAEEVTISDGDIQFSMVNCAWCSSEDIDFGEEKKNEREQ